MKEQLETILWTNKMQRRERRKKEKDRNRQNIWDRKDRKVRQSNKPLDQWTKGTTDQWANGPVGQ